MLRCRVCGHGEFGDVIDLGPMPLANNLTARPDDACARWALRVVFCRHCSLSQLTVTPPPKSMFEDYAYFSSMSWTMVEHANSLVERFVERGQRVVEIASNDGYLLQHAKRAGASILGVDPARNIAELALRRGIPTECAYFNEETATRLRREFGPANVMFALNVLAHVPQPNEIAAGIKVLLAPDGIAHVEVPHMVRLIENTAFDTIYHEHYSYFTATALAALFRRHDLEIVDVDEIGIHGGSLHMQIAHRGDSSCIDRMQRDERDLGVLDAEYYAEFASRVRQLKSALNAELGRHATVAGLGAAAKATILLNYCEIGRDRLPWVADVTPYKQGRHVPGTGQEIVPTERLVRDRPDVCLVFPWNFKREIIRRNREYLRAGGKFLSAIPELALFPRRVEPTRASRRTERPVRRSATQ